MKKLSIVLNKGLIFVCSIIVLSCLLFSCISTPLPSPEIRTIPQDFTGVVHAGRSKTQEEYALIDELGAKWILVTFYWGSMEREPGVWDFSGSDDYVNKGKEAGFKIIITLAYDTAWIHKDKKEKKYVPPEQLEHYLNFVEKTVDRYRSKVDAWSIWNEPNFGFWKGSDKDYYELAKNATIRIRETDPDAFIIGGAFLRTPSSFIKKMFKAGALDNIDAIAFHPYDINPNGSVKLYDKFEKVLAECNYTGEIWITEIGYPSDGWYPTRASEKKMPAYIVKTFAGHAARGARILMWYQLFDPYNRGEEPGKMNSEDFFGLVYPDYTYKSGTNAFVLCARFLPGSTYHPELPERINVPSSLVSLYFEGLENGNSLLLWNDKNSLLDIDVTLPGGGLIYDINTGKGKDSEPQFSLKVGNMPILINWQSTADGNQPRISMAKK